MVFPQGPSNKSCFVVLCLTVCFLGFRCLFALIFPSQAPCVLLGLLHSCVRPGTECGLGRDFVVDSLTDFRIAATIACVAWSMSCAVASVDRSSRYCTKTQWS